MIFIFGSIIPKTEFLQQLYVKRSQLHLSHTPTLPRLYFLLSPSSFILLCTTALEAAMSHRYASNAPYYANTPPAASWVTAILLGHSPRINRGPGRGEKKESGGGLSQRKCLSASVSLAFNHKCIRIKWLCSQTTVPAAPCHHTHT